MSTSREFPQSSIDDESFLPALAVGALDECLAYLRQANDIGELTAEFACRLAEALFHQGRRDEAVECCRLALPWASGNMPMLRICAWVFSNSGCHAEAGSAYRSLLELCPDWAEGYRHASFALAAIGRLDEAVALALRAATLMPDDSGVAVDAAELLMRCGRVNAAAELLCAAAATAADARLFRVLSAAEMLRGRPEAALAAVDRALAIAPDDAEYHVHRGQLLWRIGDTSGAARSLDRAAQLDPANGEIKRAQLSFYLAAGLVSEATAIGGDLLRRFPDDQPAAAAMLHLLAHRLETIDGEYLVLHDGSERAQRPMRPPLGWFDRWRSQRRVIGALIIRETRTRFADLKLGYGWALVEPILHIALLSVMFSVLMHGQPPIGKHFFIFYYTGLIPYHMFVHTSSGMSHAITGNRPVLQLPPVTTFDVVAARGLLEIMTDVVVAVILLAGFGAIGLAALPDDFWGPAMALLAMAAFGVGLGYVNAVVTVFWRSWDKAYNQLTRILYFVSGIFYVPAMMPDWARDALAWNPLLQAIDWFRAGFFAGYQPHWLDRSYLVVLAIVALLIGLGLERGLRRRLSVPL